MKKINLILIGVILLSTIHVKGQGPDWLWAKSCGSPGTDLLQSIAVDDSGNVYSIGYFEGTGDFDPDTTIFPLTSNGGEDIFILKLNDHGDFVWAKSLGGVGFDYGYSIITDELGHVYITGFFSDTVDFDPGPGTSISVSAGLNDIFVARYSSEGDFEWVRTMGGLGSDASQAIALDDSSNIVLTGSFMDTADFDPDSASTFNLTANGELEIFVAKIDSGGNFRWAKSFGGIEDDQGYNITTDTAGNVYTTGYFEKTVDFDPGPGIFNLTSAGNLPDAFISKLDRSGDFVWAKAFIGVGSNDGYSVKVDQSGNVYSTGSFNNTVDFDPDSTVVYNMTSAGAFEIFVSKLDSLGNFVWAKSMGGTDDDQAFSLALDDSCNIYTTGIFRSTADFDPDVTGVMNLSAVGGFDSFLSVFDSAGNFLWVKQAGGSSSDRGNSLLAITKDEIYLGGYFYSPSISFGTINLTNDSNSAGFIPDVFVSKLGKMTTTGIEKRIESGITIFPNPASERITIQIPEAIRGKTIMNLLDAEGRKICSNVSVDHSSIEILVRDVVDGIYFLQIISDEKSVVKKIIVQR